MLKKDWDARNVTTLVGLHACAAASNILPEQTLGRGLRRMYFGNDTPETVSVMGTPAFMAFVEGIQREGVELDQVPMGSGTRREDLLVVEVDTGDTDKDLAALDSALPRLARRWQREFQHLDKLDALAMACDPPPPAAQALQLARNPRDRLQNHVGRRRTPHRAAGRHRRG